MTPLDQEAFRLLHSLPRLPFGRLLRPDYSSVIKSKKALLEKGTPPFFTYSKAQAFPVAKYTRALVETRQAILSLDLHPIIKKLYINKLSELETRAIAVAAVQNKDDATVARTSLKLFDRPQTPLSKLQKEFEKQCEKAETGQLHLHAPTINAQVFAKMVRKTLAHYDIKDWRIKLADRSSIQIGHGKTSQPPLIRIPKNLLVTKRRARRLLTHEIEVHALRTANGEHSPLLLLGRGLAGYIKTEEGLGMWYQHQVSRKTVEHVPGFWEAWTAALMLEKGFASAFVTLRDARTILARLMGDEDAEAKGAKAAWNLCLRFSRGITHPGKPGIGFFRDHIYRDGFLNVQTFIKKSSGDDLNILFRGNLGLEHFDLIKSLNLPPGRTPEFVANDVVKEVLRNTH